MKFKFPLLFHMACEMKNMIEIIQQQKFDQQKIDASIFYSTDMKFSLQTTINKVGRSFLQVEVF